MKKPKDWATTPNTRRKRPMVTITLSPEGLARLDRLRGSSARGAYIEGVLVAAEVLDLAEADSKKRTETMGQGHGRKNRGSLKSLKNS